MNEHTPEALLKKLEIKYEATGQDLNSYLEGLYETDFLNYWDYIHLDTLLTLQIKRTTLPDEEVFIIYHQVTELYFKLILLELKQLTHAPEVNPIFFQDRLVRINRYFEILIQSFKVMMNGMEPKQFLKFRMALLPASGFQSVQYRLIEIACSTVLQLVEPESRKSAQKLPLEEQLNRIYWRKGATVLATGKKTLTLQRFEEKYNIKILIFAKEHQDKNLKIRLENLDWKSPELETLKANLRELDENANIHWPLAHFHSAMKYLNKPPAQIEATGGTNWQRYLPPKFQKTIFFPFVWTDEEMESWGKAGVQKYTVKPF
jgi:tryptophan 2,3-dioxygenase